MIEELEAQLKKARKDAAQEDQNNKTIIQRLEKEIENLNAQIKKLSENSGDAMKDLQEQIRILKEEHRIELNNN